MPAEEKAPPTEEKETDPQGSAGPGPGSRLRLVSIGLAALVVAVICWLLLKGDGDDPPAVPASPPSATTSAPPTAVDVEDLEALSSQLGYPLYWAGPRNGAHLELTQEGNGDVYVRYLTGDAKPGDPRAAFVTVGTYPVAAADAAVRRAAAKAGVEVKETPDGGVSFSNPESPGNVYLAYPGADFQIEVFTPGAGEASRLVETGRIVPVG